MITPNKPATFLLTLFLISCSASEEITSREHADSKHEEVAELILQMPASEPAAQKWLNEQLLETGPEGIRVLSAMLATPGTGDDRYARYALSSLATHVTRPGAGSEQADFERALLDEVRADHSAGAKTFLMSLLGQVGSDRSVPALEPFLTHDRLYQPAIDVLLEIQTPQAVQVIRKSLPAATGDRQIALMKALGELQDAAAVEDIRAHASAEDWPTRRMAFFALAHIGSPAANDDFIGALEPLDPDHSREVVSLYLTYADRLAQEGHPQMSSEISRWVLHGDYSDHVKSRALSTLFMNEGDQILDELLEQAGTADSKLAVSALAMINTLEGQVITEMLVSTLNRAPEPRIPDIITALGERGDPSAASEVAPFLESSSMETRMAASQALVRLSGSERLPALIMALNRAEDEREREALQTALLQVPTQDLTAALAEALPNAGTSAKPVLIRMLAERRASEHRSLVVRQAENENGLVRLEVYRYLQQLGDPEDIPFLLSYLPADLNAELGLAVERDEALNGDTVIREEITRGEIGGAENRRAEVRKAEISAIQEAITGIINRAEEPEKRAGILLQALDEASDTQKRYLLAILPNVEPGKTLPVLRDALHHREAAIRYAAAAALSEWPDAFALPELLDAATVAPDSSSRAEVYAGYVRLVNSLNYPVDKKVTLLQDLVQTTEDSREISDILIQFTALNDLTALQAVSPYFHHEEETVRQASTEVASEILLHSYDPDSEVLNSSNAVLAVLDDSIRPVLARHLEKKMEKHTEATGRQAGQLEAPAGKSPEKTIYGRLFNGYNLEGWEAIGGDPDGWDAADGILFTTGGGRGWLSTTSQYDDFILELEYRLPVGANTGVFLRAPREGSPAFEGMEIQILDDYADKHSDLQPWQYTGSIYAVKAPSKQVTKPAGEWQSMKIKADGPEIQVTINGEMIVNTSLIRYMDLVDDHPGLIRRSGYIGLQNYGDRVEFRNIIINEVR